uniref:Uncharacterized protein n=1 Tax=uncultured marine virus TaxID=186617 RepID=A0A0F7L0L3_9VIRU|nr:hypothetical protein [uncultured marine virus]
MCRYRLSMQLFLLSTPGTPGMLSIPPHHNLPLSFDHLNVRYLPLLVCIYKRVKFV